MKFEKIKGATVVTWEKGVFKIADVYESEGLLFAAAKGGFVRIENSKSTSYKGLRWKSIHGVDHEPSGVFNSVRVKNYAN